MRFRHDSSSVKRNSQKQAANFESLPSFVRTHSFSHLPEIRFIFLPFSPVLLHGVCICSVTHLMNRFCSLCWHEGSISRVLGTERNLIGWNFVQEVRLEKHARRSSASTRTSPLLSPSKPTSSVIGRFNCSLVTGIHSRLLKTLKSFCPRT